MPLATLISAAGAILVLLGSSLHLRRAHLGHLRQLEFWVPPAAALWPFLSTVLLQLIGIQPSDVARSLIALTPLLALGAMRIVLSIARRQTRVGVTAVGIAAVTVAAAVVAAFTGQSWAWGLLAVSSIVSVGLSARDRVPAVLAGVGASVAGLSLLLAAWGLLIPGLAFRDDCGANEAKCSLLGGFVSIGMWGGSNAFGITLAMIMGIAVWRAGRLGGALIAIGAVAVVLASGARLATACAVVIVAFAMLAQTRYARPVVWSATGLAALGSTVIAATPFPPDSFTERAALWDRARAMIAERPLFGHGLSHWVRDAVTQPHPPRSYSPHNIWLDLLVAVGFVGTGAIVIAVVAGLVLAVRAHRIPVLLLTTGILTVGAFEATMMAYRPGPIPGGMLVLVLLLTAAQRDRVTGEASALNATPASPAH